MAGNHTFPGRDDVDADSLRLDDVLADLARSVESENDLTGTVGSIVDAVRVTVPHADHVGLCLLEERGPRSVAASSTLTATLEQVQRDLGEGPSMDPRTTRPHRAGDLASDPRWPRFAEAATERGVVSMLALPLFTTNAWLGMLTLFSAEPHAFDGETEHLAELFAAQAAVAIAGVNRTERMRAALTTRDVIGTAKGILMQRHQLDAEAAFALLVRASRHTDRTLRDVAEWLVTGRDAA
ncbi:GAF and ANTAR domain-containing protein [Saccharomonospora saliphila]|uniref:GAF and ANTAR domain-containing protein n=1 Tax=Saccharomonospora saliphila TaxID=369829 RepID=UPI0003773BC4|nr:GAF and ANTAR domain-containing protein [Saccharomonospora saliphila]